MATRCLGLTFSVLFFVTIGVTQGSTDTGTECSHENILHCKSFHTFDPKVPTENLTREDFNENCPNASRFKDCVDRIECRPDDRLYDIRLKYADVADGYAYLCTPRTQQAFFIDPSCLRIGFVHHNTDCDDSVSQPKNDRDRCRYLYERAACAYNWTMQTCNNPRVAEVLKNVIVNAHMRQYQGTHGCTVGRCKEVDMEECSAYRQLKSDIELPKLFYDTARKLDAVCDNLDNLKQCVADTSCQGYRNRTVDRYIKAFIFVCTNRSRQVYLDNVQCYTSTEKFENFTTCAINTTERIYLFQDKCLKKRDERSCRRRVYAASCGPEAADVVIRARDELEDSHCRRFYGSAARTSSMLTATTVASLATVVALAVRHAYS